MGANGGAYFELQLFRGDVRPRPFVYRPKDRSLPPYNLTGKTITLKIQPQGQSEIIYSAAPEIAITNAAAGEFTIAIPAATVTGYQFQNAAYVILLDGKRLLHGPLTVKGLYE